MASTTDTAVKDPVTSTDGAGQDDNAIFNEAQQKKLDEIIQKRLARANKEKTEEVKTLQQKVTDLTSQLSDAQESLKKASTTSERADAAESVEGLKNKLEEVEKASKAKIHEVDELRRQLVEKDKSVDFINQRMLDLRKKTEMTLAIQNKGFVDPELVLLYSEKYLSYNKDTDSFEVVNDKGAPRFNASGEAMNISELYDELAQQKKHLVRTDLLSGLSSSENKISIAGKSIKLDEIFGAKSDGKKANELALRDYPKYKQLKQQAKEQGLIK